MPHLLQLLWDNSFRVICFAFCLSSISYAQGQSLNELFKNLNQTDSSQKHTVLAQIGQWYQNQKIHGKSIEYYQKARDRGKKAFTAQEHIEMLEQVGLQYQQIADYSNAIDAYNLLLAYTNTNNRTAFLEDLSSLYETNGDFAEALRFKLAYMQTNQANNQKLSHTFLGEVAYLYEKTGQYPLAVSYYKQAINATDEELWKNKHRVALAACYIRMHQKENAKQLLDLLIDVNSKSHLELPNAQAYSDVAFIYYSLGNYRNAVSYGQHGLNPKVANSNDVILKINLYKLLKKSNEALQNYRVAVDFSQKHLSLLNEYEIAQKERRQEFLQQEVEAEREEGIIRDFIAQQQRQEASLVQERLEGERRERELQLREKELALLKQQQELKNAQLAKQKLEREQIEQQLLLAEQQALSEARKREIDKKEIENIEQRLLAENAENDRIRQEKELEVVKKEQALQATQLEQQKTQQLYSYIFMGLVAAILILVILGYRSSLKSRRILQAKSAEVRQRNTDLLLVQDALQSQKDATEEKNKELEVKNMTITSSLNYATNIQGAILPSDASLSKHFAEHFVIYRPKDVVSGDFYWLEELPNGNTVIASVDCTGHGIPGAFMSMIGHTLMNEIMLSENIHTPAAVLEHLHEKVRLALHQEESNNRDGMDACICLLELPKDGEALVKVTYAGARIPLYYHLAGAEKIEMTKPTKRSLGGEQYTQKEFEETVLQLPKGSTLYFSTDGIVDQSNPERRRFGKARLIEALDQHKTKPLPEQGQEIASTIRDFQQEEEQRDDITLIGVRL